MKKFTIFTILSASATMKALTLMAVCVGILSVTVADAGVILNFTDIRLDDGSTGSGPGLPARLTAASSTGTFSSDNGVVSALSAGSSLTLEDELLPNTDGASAVSFGVTLSNVTDLGEGLSNATVTFDLVATVGGTGTDIHLNTFGTQDAWTVGDSRINLGETIQFSIENLVVDGASKTAGNIVFSDPLSDNATAGATLTSAGLVGATVDTRFRGFDLQFEAFEAVVPEPSTLAMLVMGGLLICLRRKAIRA